MTEQLTTRTRLVKCPRCRRVLPELPNVPIYQCGGCGTFLQAKKHKNDSKGTRSNVHQTDGGPEIVLEHLPCDKEATSLIQGEVLPSSRESPLDKIHGSGQIKIPDGNREHSGDVTFSGELSTEVMHKRTEVPESAVEADTEIDQDECSLEQNEQDQNEYGYLNERLPGGISFSTEIASSTELDHHQSEESSLVAGVHREMDLNQNDGSNQNGYQYCNSRDPAGTNSDEVALSTEISHHGSEESSPFSRVQGEVDQNSRILEQINGRNQTAQGEYSGMDLNQNDGRNQNGYQYCNSKDPAGTNTDEVASSTEISHHGSEESSPFSRVQGEVDQNSRILEQINGRNQTAQGEYSGMDLNQNDGRNQNGYQYCNSKDPAGTYSDEVASSTEISHHGSEESSPFSGVQGEVDQNSRILEQINGRNQTAQGEYSGMDLNQNDGRNQNGYQYCNSKDPAGTNSDEVVSSTEVCHHGSEESSPFSGVQGEVDQNSRILEQINGRNQNAQGEYSGMDLNQNDGRNQNGYQYCNSKDPAGTNTNEVASSTEISHHGSEESSPFSGVQGEVDQNSRILEQINGRNQTAQGEYSGMDLNQNDGRNQNGYQYCNSKDPAGTNSDEVASSTEISHHGSEESSPFSGVQGEVDQNSRILEQINGRNQTAQGEYSGMDLNQNDGRNQNGYQYCNSKDPAGTNSDEVASSTEISHHGSEESSPFSGVQGEVDQNSRILEQINGRNQTAQGEYSGMDLNQNDGRNQNGYQYCNSKDPAGTNSDEVASSTEISHHGSEESSPFSGVQGEVDQNSRILEQINGRNQTAQGEYSGMNHSECGDYKRESNENMKISDEVTSSVIRTFCTELAQNFKSQFRSLGEESVLASSPKGSNITTQRPLSESILTDNHMSPCIEQLEQSQESGLDRVSSVDAMENIALANPSSEFSVMLRHMPKSPTTRSYYAHDGSDSSYDGTDDHHNRPISKRKLKEAVSASSRTMPRRDEIINKITSRYPEIQNLSSISSDNKHYPVEGSKWSQDELLESRKCGHPVRSRKKYERDEWLPKVSFYSRSAQFGNENGSLSDFGQSEFQSITSFHSPSRSEYHEEEKLEQLKWVNKEKMELLKMVYELQDQLHRTCIIEEKTNERFPGVSGKEKQISPHHEYEVPEPEIFHNLSNTRYTTRFNRGRSWSRQSQVSRIPFSAEASIIRNQFDCSCLHCSPQDWQYLAPSPLHECCNGNQYTAHTSQRSHNLCHSSPSIQHHYTGSEFSGGCDVKSENHWYTNRNELQEYSKERRHLAKRHVRPLRGGAPFLTCYNCLELLQLPADFLVFQRRCHRLKCSACSFELKFSLQNRIHLVPNSDFADDVIAPLPSEVDACSNSNREKLVWLSHANNYPDAGPASCTDDHGPSLNKTSSTEGESFAVGPPFHAIGRGSNDRKASFDRPPSKLSSEIEELPPPSSSPLHWLMGYSSPSEVMYN